MNAALEGVEWSAARPGRTLPPGKTWYPFYRRLVGPRAGLDGRKILSSSGFDPGPSRPSSVAIPTELPSPYYDIYIYIYHNMQYTYLFTPCSTVLLQNLTVSQPVKKLPTFYGTQRLITTFTRAHHLSPSGPNMIQSTSSHSTS